jgi:nucleoside phosphorylase
MSDIASTVPAHAAPRGTDILLVTVTEVEARAVFDALYEQDGRNAVRRPIGGKIYYDLGLIGGAAVWMVQSEMGAGGLGAALLTVQKGIDALAPAGIIMVGIAFGVNPKKQRIGDILVARQIMLYDLQRVGQTSSGQLDVRLRGDRPSASAWLLDACRSGALDWQHPLPGGHNPVTSDSPSPLGNAAPAKVRFGLMLSGEKLIDNEQMRDQLLAHEPEAIGGEMEGAGLYVAASDRKVDWILIKAICDWADGNKARNKEQRQQIAARQAAQFVCHVLAQGGLAPHRNENQSSGSADSPAAENNTILITNNAPNYGPQGIFNAPLYYQIVEHPPDKNRAQMLQKVKSIWVTGLLEQSFANSPRMDLDMIGDPDAVLFPLQAIVQELAGVSRNLPTNAAMINIFAAYGGQLLILGAPGTGKTTLLLELARDLIVRAEQDTSHPIPVVFNLSSWAGSRKSLADWIVDELKQLYDIQQSVAHAWVKENALLPLLDGLDEVEVGHRMGCVAAINSYRQEHGLVPIAICSRINEYRSLGILLRLHGAILVQNLSSAQVEAFVNQANIRHTGLSAALASDAELRALVDTPLMLHILRLIYQENETQITSVGATSDERRRFILNAYIKAMFQRRGKETIYSKSQMLRWLGWLAQCMVEHNQAVFYIELMQPDWLSQPAQRRFDQYIGVLRGVLVGVGVGLIIGTAGIFPAAMLWPDLWRYLGISGVVLSAVINSVGFAAIFGFIGLSTASRGGTEVIALVERLVWSASAARRGAMLGLSVGLITGIAVSLVYGFLLGVLAALTLALALSLLVLVRDAGWRDDEVRSVPNQGIWRSARNALLISAGVGLSSGAAIGLVLGVIVGVSLGIVFGIAFGGGVSLFMWLFFGGETYLKHFLLRAMLSRGGVIPWAFPRVLELAVNRVLLRQLGGGYIFVHRLLLEYFAKDMQAPVSDFTQDY